MRKLHLDFETRSAIDIKKCGAWGYALHPSTETICLSISLDGERPRVFTGAQIAAGLEEVKRYAQDPGVRFVAHSAHFEYAVYNLIMHRRMGYPALWDPKRWDCTLSRAVMCGLPAALEKLALALNLPSKKDMEGRAALMKICKPVGFDPISGKPIYNEDPALYAKVYSYCGIDVETEMAADAVLPELPASERRVWELDLVINRRGFAVDLELCRTAAALAGALTKALNARLHDLTCTTPKPCSVATCTGIEKATRVQAIKQWLDRQGMKGVDSLDKHAVDLYLQDPDVPTHVKEVLSIRRQVGKSSTAKYAATIDAACPDGRIRGGLQYHAAATGRWGGRLVQPHNYPKGIGEAAQAEAIGAVLMEPWLKGFFEMKYGERGMQTLSDILRGTIIATPGKELFVADFVGIEFAVEMWEADDEIALAQLRRGEKPYVEMANYIFKRTDCSKHGTPHEYAVGKMAVLGCGYGMGADRFQAQCAQAGILISLEVAQMAVDAYREKYRSVVNMWYATERAAVAAIKAPGSVQPAMNGRVLFGMTRDRRFLACKLPSGRFLFYYRPSIKGSWVTFCKDEACPHVKLNRVEECPKKRYREEIHYWAPGLSGALEEFKTYGGSLVENITQAIARDLLANGLLNAEEAGYEGVLSVHDEGLSEREKGKGSIEEFMRLLCTTPAWAAGCPVTAEGWVGERYRK